MIARVLLLRYPQNVAALGPNLWMLLGCAHSDKAAFVPRATGRCAALLELHELRSEVLPR